MLERALVNDVFRVLYSGTPLKTDTIGTNDFVHCSKISLGQGCGGNDFP